MWVGRKMRGARVQEAVDFYNPVWEGKYVWYMCRVGKCVLLCILQKEGDKNCIFVFARGIFLFFVGRITTTPLLAVLPN